MTYVTRQLLTMVAAALLLGYSYPGLGMWCALCAC
jgi:hypothetical protein